MSVASVCVTYEEEPNIILIVDEGFTIATLAKHPRLIWSARFTGATEIPSLVIADLASLQDRVPCQLTHIIETAGGTSQRTALLLRLLATHSTSWKMSPPRNCIL